MKHGPVARAATARRLRRMPHAKDAGRHPPFRVDDHRIVTSKDQSLPEEAYLLTTPELPDLVHIDAVPGTNDQIPPLTLLRAYGELAISDPQYARSYLKILDQLAQTNPGPRGILRPRVAGIRQKHARR